MSILCLVGGAAGPFLATSMTLRGPSQRITQAVHHKRQPTAISGGET